MIAPPGVSQGFQVAPGPTGARRGDIPCDLLPPAGASSVLASMGDALILSDLAGADAAGQPLRHSQSRAQGMAERQQASPSVPDPDLAPDAAQRIWLRAVGDSVLQAEVAGSANRLCADLRIGMLRWIGGEAYRALVARALGETTRGHPVLAGLTWFGEEESAFRAAVRTHGAGALAAGMVAVLRAMISLLGRIMGDEMAVHLVEQNCLPSLREGGRRARAEDHDG